MREFLEKEVDPILNNFFYRNKDNKVTKEIVVGLRYFLIQGLSQKWAEYKTKREVTK